LTLPRFAILLASQGRKAGGIKLPSLLNSLLPSVQRIEANGGEWATTGADVCSASQFSSWFDHLEATGDEALARKLKNEGEVFA
jgi:hypothetical protein